MHDRGVFFDLYGTLLLFGDMERAWQDWLRAFHAGVQRAGAEHDLPELARVLDGFLGMPEPPDAGRGRTVFERRVLRSCGELGITLSDAELATLSDDAVGAWQQHVSIDPVADDVLNDLRSTHRLGLVSNFDHDVHVRRVLETTGLATHFETIVISAEVGHKKPDPCIFSTALEDTGLRPSLVTYVGDGEVDVEAARGAGIRPILIRRGGGPDGISALDSRRDEPPAPSLGDDVQTIRCLTELRALLTS